MAYPLTEAPLCAVCGKDAIPTKDGRRWRRFCGDECMYQAFLKRKNDARRGTSVRKVMNKTVAPETVDRIGVVAKMEGVDKSVLLEAIETEKLGGEVSIPEKIDNEYLIAGAENSAARVLASISREDILKANLQQKGAFIARAIEIRQLLKGEPTSIRSYGETKSMRELLVAAVREAEIRGITIEGDFQVDDGLIPDSA